MADEVQKVGGEGMKPGEMNKNKPEQIGNQQIHNFEQNRFSQVFLLFFRFFLRLGFQHNQNGVSNGNPGFFTQQSCGFPTKGTCHHNRGIQPAEIG